MPDAPEGDRGSPSPRALAGLTERGVWIAACVAGAALRVLLAVARPLWHDEIYTVELARDGVARILAALAEDTGPPLFYLLASPIVGPVAGPWDGAVRLLSLVASLLHLPLLLVVARRIGHAGAGWRAAGLFALCPLAVHYGAEARGYALASLLVLAALERSLALLERRSPASIALLAVCCAGAVLTHYLALLALLGLPWLLRRADGAARARLLAAWALGAALAAPWAPVALAQPPGGLAWVSSIPMRARAARLLVNLCFGADQAPAALVALALAFAALVAWGLWRGRERVVLGLLATSAAATAIAASLRPDILIPVRTVLCVLPLVVLAVALAGRTAVLVAALAYTVVLAVETPKAFVETPGQQLARFLDPTVRSGRTVCVAGIGALELDYRFRRAGLPARVVYFPSDVRRHPGWHDDRVPVTPVLRAEARALIEGVDRPGVYVLPHGARASQALRERLNPLGARRIGYSAWVEVVALPAMPGPRGSASAPSR
jgi:hypothetical protein